MDPTRVIDSSVDIPDHRMNERREHWRFVARERNSGVTVLRYAIRTEIRLITSELAIDLARFPGLRPERWDLNTLATLIVNAMISIAEASTTPPTTPDRRNPPHRSQTAQDDHHRRDELAQAITGARRSPAATSAASFRSHIRHLRLGAGRRSDESPALSDNATRRSRIQPQRHPVARCRLIRKTNGSPRSDGQVLLDATEVGRNDSRQMSRESRPGGVTYVDAAAAVRIWLLSRCWQLTLTDEPPRPAPNPRIRGRHHNKRRRKSSGATSITSG